MSHTVLLWHFPFVREPARWSDTAGNWAARVFSLMLDFPNSPASLTVFSYAACSHFSRKLSTSCNKQPHSDFKNVWWVRPFSDKGKNRKTRTLWLLLHRLYISATCCSFLQPRKISCLVFCNGKKSGSCFPWSKQLTTLFTWHDSLLWKFKSNLGFRHSWCCHHG